MKPVENTNHHCPTLIGPRDRLWSRLVREAKDAGISLDAGERAMWFEHEDDE